ncbi:hypothetical protein GCM10010195_11120 [Kitasatospora griseola]|nr:hypothetical protein GCM10010195_11120 [Kitasatospora griseola]
MRTTPPEHERFDGFRPYDNRKCVRARRPSGRRPLPASAAFAVSPPTPVRSDNTTVERRAGPPRGPARLAT